jgi:hypothetical protein
MAWLACERYALQPAPGGLALVQDLLNTRPQLSTKKPDLLGTVQLAQQWSDTALRGWAEASGRPWRKAKVGKADVEPLRDIRSQLVSVLRGRDYGEEPGAGLVALGGVEVGMTVTETGMLLFEPSGSGWRWIAGAVAIEVHDAQVSDTFRRLKTCRDPRCPGGFYDRSPNNSGTWHDVRTCGNVANLRASRARRRSETA